MTTPKSAVEAAGHVGDARRRQRPDQHDVDAGGDEARLERRLEHVAREARVLADQHRAALGRQHAGRRARQLQREVDGHRVLAHAPATPSVPKYRRRQLPHPPALHARPRLAAHRPSRPRRARGRCARRPAPRAPRAPRCRRRARRRGQPVSVPTIDLRDKPTNTGSPSRARARAGAAAASDCAPGSCRSRSPDRPRCAGAPTPAAAAGRHALGEERPHLADHVGVVRRALHGARLALHVHQAHARSRSPPPPQRPGRAQRAHVVDEPGAGGRAAARMTSGLLVSTEITAGVAARRRSITGSTRRSSSARVDRRRARSRRFAADVDERRALGRHAHAVLAPPPRASRKRPPSEKESGVTLSTPMTTGPAQIQRLIGAAQRTGGDNMESDARRDGE